jgi:uncharacterized spore protein YtfJ
MDTREVLQRVRDSVGVGRVLGEPIEREGVTVIPAATVFGGGGGGVTTSPEGGGDATAQDSAGYGFGMAGWPAGAFEIKDGRVRWQPAIDYTRIAMAVAFLVYLLLRARRS